MTMEQLLALPVAFGIRTAALALGLGFRGANQARVEPQRTEQVRARHPEAEAS